MAKKLNASDASSLKAEVPVTVIDSLNRDGVAYEDGDVLALPLADARQLKAAGVVEFDEADIIATDPTPPDPT